MKNICLNILPRFRGFIGALLTLCSVVMAVVLFPPGNAFAKEKEFYTVIAGSYRSAALAEKDFAVIVDQLTESEKEYLRIEMVGGYATIRVGKFAGKASAEELVGHVRQISRFSQARVLSAYYRPVRIVKLYRGEGQVPDAAVLEDTDKPPAISTEVLPANMGAEPFVEESLAGEEEPGDEVTTPKESIRIDGVEEPDESEVKKPVAELSADMENTASLEKKAASGLQGLQFKAIGGLAEADLNFISELIGEPYGPALALEAEKKMVEGASGKARGAKEDLALPKKLTYEVITILDKDDRGEDIRMPSALFFDRQADELYLINGVDRRIIVYGADYFAQNSIGKGRGVESPLGGVVDAQGNVYITQVASESGPTRLTILNSAFLLKKEIAVADIPDSEGFVFQKVAVGLDGTVYVTGVNYDRVLELDAAGNFKKWFTVPTDKRGNYVFSDGASEPEVKAKIKDIKVDSLGNIIFLSELSSKIYVFSPDEKFLFNFGQKGGAFGKTSRPRGIAIDEEKHCFYVVDYMRHTILIYDFAGNFRYEFGGRGWGPEWFNYPSDITLGRHGQLVVADLFNQRAQVFEVTLPELLPERSPELWGDTASKGEK